VKKFLPPNFIATAVSGTGQGAAPELPDQDKLNNISTKAFGLGGGSGDVSQRFQKKLPSWDSPPVNTISNLWM
jgi:hypothetical protein